MTRTTLAILEILESKIIRAAFFLFCLLTLCCSQTTIPLRKSSKEEYSTAIFKGKKQPSFLQIAPGYLYLNKQANYGEKLITYFGEVGVGEGTSSDPKEIQYFRMLFDTGSCDFWIPSETCESEVCTTRRKYKHSLTYKPFLEAELSINYQDGKVEGELINEVVNIGGLRVSQIIGIANYINFTFLQKVDYDGIIGRVYLKETPSLAYPSTKHRERSINPLLDSMMAQRTLVSKGLKNIFSIFLGDYSGAITFGGWDQRFMKGNENEIVWAVLAETNYWTLEVLDVYRVDFDDTGDNPREVRPKMPICPKGCKSVLDTGTYFIYGPKALFNQLVSDLNVEDCNKLNSLPDFVFVLASSAVKDGKKRVIKLRLRPQDYVVQLGSQCVIGIATDDEDAGITFGQLLTKSYYSIFDRENQRIGKEKVKKVLNTAICKI